jgi:hypothetical protein
LTCILRSDQRYIAGLDARRREQQARFAPRGKNPAIAMVQDAPQTIAVDAIATRLRLGSRSPSSDLTG